MNDPATPFWVNMVLMEIARRDPVDAANCMEVLADFANKRAAEALEVVVE